MNKGKMTVDSPEETARKVAEWRAAGILPPRGKSHEYVKRPDSKIVNQISSGIGDCLKSSFAEYAMEFLPSCSCTALREALNRTSHENVTAKIDEFVDKVAANVQHAKGWKGAILKAINWAAPDEVKAEIRGILVECIAKAVTRESDSASQSQVAHAVEPESPSPPR